MAAVERQGIHAIDLVHQQRQIGLPGVQYKVVMVVHKTVGEHLRIEA